MRGKSKSSRKTIKEQVSEALTEFLAAQNSGDAAVSFCGVNQDTFEKHTRALALLPGIKSTVDELQKVVCKGNGTASLVTQIQVIDTDFKNHKEQEVKRHKWFLFKVSLVMTFLLAVFGWVLSVYLANIAKTDRLEEEKVKVLVNNIVEANRKLNRKGR